VEFVEQPVAPDSRGAGDQLRGLSADYPVPIGLDESIAGDLDIARWMDAGWAGYFVIKPALLRDAPGVLERLAKAKARVVFSSALETALGARAALCEAFAWPGEARALGFGVWPLFANPAFDGPAAAPFLRIEDVERIEPEALWNALN
jgi:O-succinylbenzoate synthase